PAIPHSVVLSLAPMAAALAIITLYLTGSGVIMIAIAADLFALFALALACHGALNHNRPHAGRLTEFYLLMSLGGVLGGAFNALVAPLIFDSVLEYPLMLIAGIALLAIGAPSRFSRLTIYLLVAAVLALQLAI